MQVLLTAQGTAASETALCDLCYRSASNRDLARMSADVDVNPFSDFTAATNEALRCTICGDEGEEGGRTDG